MGNRPFTDVIRDASLSQTHVRVENHTNAPIAMYLARNAEDPRADNAVRYNIAAEEITAIVSGWFREPRATILMRTGLQTAVLMRVPNGGRLLVSLAGAYLTVEAARDKGEEVEIEDFPDALEVPGLDTIPMRACGESFANVQVGDMESG